MSSLANDPSYQNTINNSISLTGSVATTAFDLAGEGTVLSSTNALNTDANNNSNAPSSGVLVYPISRPDTLDYLQVTTIKYVSGGLPSEGTFATTPVGKRMTERGTSI